MTKKQIEEKVKIHLERLRLLHKEALFYRCKRTK